MEMDLVVKTQKELDDAKYYNGRVIIQFGTPLNKAIVTGGYKYSVVARENSSVEAWGKNVRVLDAMRSAKIITRGNPQIVYLPQTIDEYIDYYGIEEFTDDTVTLYKAVHKDNQGYRSDYSPSFRYNIGEIVETKYFDESAEIERGEGIHLAHINWALDFGSNFGCDLAILELKAKKEDIVIPILGSGKVRARKAKVIREVPLEECGLYGKILERRYAKK